MKRFKYLFIIIIMPIIISSCIPRNNENSSLNNLEEDEKDSLDCWIGEYSFSESSNTDDGVFMVMNYNIKIYKENERYYGEIRQVGQNCLIENKTRVIGNTEWISLVMDECLNDKSYYPFLKDCVYVSFRSDGQNLYTYWGFCESLLKENRQSGRVYFIKNDNDLWIPKEYDLNNWIGEYEYFNQKANEKYFINIYEKEGKYSANIQIKSSTDLEIETEVIGSEEWIALVCSENIDSCELIENSVILYFEQQKDSILTYWGDKRFLSVITEDEMSYYNKNEYFIKK